MKRSAILFLSLVTTVAFAQSKRTADPRLEVQDMPAKRLSPQATPESQAVFWSEDFANGIPSTWSQNGTPSNAQWEYRGPSTTPDNNSGSRGAFSGIGGNPPTNDPIFSTTRSNGFVIFDSDYLDNGGDPNGIGTGTAIAPHVGRLVTETIDLSSHTDVELKFESYARRFFANFQVAFSTDGGATWGDTLVFHPTAEVATNESTDNAEVNLANVSGFIGGQSNVRIQFIFDGTPGNVNGNGYYFWMIDDIELRDPPRNQLFFTTVTFPNGATAPASDIIYGGNGASAKYGIMHDNQVKSVEFDANIYNYGTQAQDNVGLEVEIWDANGPTLITTVSSPTCATLNPLDTCDFNTLTTSSWTPTQAGSYLFVYKAISDSISSANTTTTDTLPLFVSQDFYSLDRNQTDNFVGTNSSNPDMIAMGVTFELMNEDPDSAGAGLVFLDGVEVALSALTDSTADVEFAIYDTTGFIFNSGLPAGATPIFRQVFSLDGSFPGTVAFFDFTTPDSIWDGNAWNILPNPLAIPTGNWMLVMTFFPNATDGVIRIANDASVGQPAESAVFQVADGNWFGGFTNSSTFESPHIRLVVGEAPPYDISLEEMDANNFSVYPNPTNGAGTIQFEMGGAYQIQVLDMVGNTVVSREAKVNANERVELNLSNLPAGVYLVNVNGEGLNKTIKLTVQ